MPKILWKHYKNHSGLQINGTISVTLPAKYKSNHMWRAFYLTAQLEAPKWGSVQSYDGAGISGGPFHYTAYSPSSGKQGSLFSLLRAIELGLGTQRNKNLEALWKLFKECGWFVARDGKLRDINEGYEIKGIDILKEFAPPNGAVPKNKDSGYYIHAERIALAFYNLLSDPATFHAQTEHAIEYLVRGQKALEIQAYSTLMGYQDKDVINSPEIITISEDINENGPHLKYDEDLAMCVYHSHSVNAPGPARNCLQQAMSASYIPKRLIHLLGTSNYGRWHDTKDGRNRYDRTRLAAIKSKLWSESLFSDDGIMPENIKE